MDTELKIQGINHVVTPPIRKKDMDIWNKIIGWIVDDGVLDKTDNSWEFRNYGVNYEISLKVKVNGKNAQANIHYFCGGLNLNFINFNENKVYEFMQIELDNAPPEFKNNLIRLNDYINDKKHLLIFNDKEYNCSVSFDANALTL